MTPTLDDLQPSPTAVRRDRRQLKTRTPNGHWVIVTEERGDFFIQVYAADPAIRIRAPDQWYFFLEPLVAQCMLHEIWSWPPGYYGGNDESG